MSREIEPDPEVLEAFRDDARGLVRALVLDMFETMENFSPPGAPDHPNYLKAVYESFALGLGVVDGVCAIRGVPQALRQKELRTAFLTGKQVALAKHKEQCPDCRGAKELEAELEELH